MGETRGEWCGIIMGRSERRTLSARAMLACVRCVSVDNLTDSRHTSQRGAAVQPCSLLMKGCAPPRPRRVAIRPHDAVI